MSPRAKLGEELLAVIERLVDARVERKLLDLGVGTAEYATANLPPGTTARTFHAWCRSGRVGDARRDGRGWRCSVAAWRDARAEGAKRAPRLTLVADPLDADALLEAAGLRATRGRGR